VRSISALGEDSASLPEVPRGPGDNGLTGRSDGRAGHDRSAGPKAVTLMRHIGHFLDQWFGDADSKRLSVPEQFASLETVVSQALSLAKNRTRRPAHESRGLAA
jgi:hypothetical protein